MRVRKSEVQNPGVRLPMAEDELSEISVVRDQDTPLAMRNSEDIHIL
jgi:hypothetical protein